MFTLWENVASLIDQYLCSIYTNIVTFLGQILASLSRILQWLYISRQIKQLVASVFLSLQETSEFYFQFFYYIELLLMSKVRTLDYMLPFKGTLKKDPGVKNICTQRNSIREQRGNELVSVLIRKAIIKAQRLRI